MSLLLNAQEVELLSALRKHGVRYIVIGGHAVIFHGHLRAAKDLDLWLEPTSENALRLTAALSMIRVSLSPAYQARLALPNAKMPINGLHTEFLTSVAGLEFESAFAESVAVIEQGVPCCVLGLAHLIKCKRALGRTNDLDDVEHLERLQRGA